MDIVSTEVRSRMMRGIPTRDTKPEILFRKGLHKRGFRYRLHPKLIPGKPDFVLPQHRVVAFVHGCFWHQHDCALFKAPSTRREFWSAKLARNRARDAEVATQVIDAGWRLLTVWECAFRGAYQLGLEDALDIAAEWLPGTSLEMEIRGRR